MQPEVSCWPFSVKVNSGELLGMDGVGLMRVSSWKQIEYFKGNGLISGLIQGVEGVDLRCCLTPARGGGLFIVILVCLNRKPKKATQAHRIHNTAFLLCNLHLYRRRERRSLTEHSHAVQGSSHAGTTAQSTPLCSRGSLFFCVLLPWLYLPQKSMHLVYEIIIQWENKMYEKIIVLIFYITI